MQPAMLVRTPPHNTQATYKWNKRQTARFSRVFVVHRRERFFQRGKICFPLLLEVIGHKFSFTLRRKYWVGLGFIRLVQVLPWRQHGQPIELAIMEGFEEFNRHYMHSENNVQYCLNFSHFHNIHSRLHSVTI